MGILPPRDGGAPLCEVGRACAREGTHVAHFALDDEGPFAGDRAVFEAVVGSRAVRALID